MELKDLRAQIDKVNEELLSLFLRRMQLSDEVAKYKKVNGLAVYNEKREQEILDWATRESGTMDDYARRFFSNLFELSRSRQLQNISDDQMKEHQEA